MSDTSWRMLGEYGVFALDAAIAGDRLRVNGVRHLRLDVSLRGLKANEVIES